MSIYFRDFTLIERNRFVEYKFAIIIKIIIILLKLLNAYKETHMAKMDDILGTDYFPP